MNNLLTVSCFLGLSLLLFCAKMTAQELPQGIRYQAIIRDGNQLLTNASVTIEFSVVQNGVTTYQEQQALITNSYGLLLATIGEGTPLIGQFDSIVWVIMPTELNIRIDKGNGMVDIGKERLLTVPYAFEAAHARTVEKVSFFDLIEVSGALPAHGQVLTWNGGEWIGQTPSSYAPGPGIGINNWVIENTGDLDPGDDIVQGTTAGGDLSGTFPAPTVSKLAGRNLASTSPTSGQVLKWNGTQWEPATDNTIPNIWQQSVGNGNIFYQGGAVSIGTNSPAGYQLRVNGGGMWVNNPQSGPEDGMFVTANANDPDYAAIYASNNGVGAAGYFTSSTGLALYADGEVGFGTKTPATSFEIQTNTNSVTDAVRIHNTGTGDAMLKFALGGNDEFSLGVDNSDGDRFKIGIGNSLTSNTAMTIMSNQRIGIGVNTPPTRLAIAGGLGGVNSSGSIRYYADVLSNGAGTFQTRGANGADNVRISTSSSGANNGKVTVLNASGIEKAGLQINASGQGVVFGDVKNFRMAHPGMPEKEIWYASLEGAEAAAYLRGTAQLKNGRATIHFPEHFSIVANPATMTIILTPLSLQSKGLAAFQKSEKGFEVGELLQGSGSYEFDWEVKCVRNGFEEFEVVRERKTQR